MTVILLQVARYPVHSSIGLAVVVLGIPVAGWVIPDHRSTGEMNAIDSTPETTSPDSTLDEPSEVPAIGTNS